MDASKNWGHFRTGELYFVRIVSTFIIVLSWLYFYQLELNT